VKSFNFPASSEEMASSSKITMLVNSCDSYQDVIPLFSAALDKYWPNRGFDVAINYESSPLLSYSDQKKREKTWGARLLDILSAIDTEYVIMVFDDFILESPVDQKKVQSAIQVLDSDSDSSVFYLNSVCFKTDKEDPNADYRILNDSSDYRLNSAPAIWRKSELMRYTKSVDNPWSWEVFGSYRTFGPGKRFYCTSCRSKNLIDYNFMEGGAIYRGKWVRKTVEPKVTEYGLDIDLNIRGFSSETEVDKRSVSWKLDFLMIGWRSIRFRMITFCYRYVKTKLKARVS